MSGLMINWDDSAFFYYISKGYGKDIKDSKQAYECAKAVIDQYENTAVTDFIMCVNARLASYPSKTIENYGDSYRRKVQNGINVDYSDTWASSFHKFFEILGIDHFQIWIDRLNELNIKPWISIRMNDAHQSLEKTSLLAPDYYYENPHLRRVTHHKTQGYFDGLYDYGKKQVRDRFLNFVDETLARYDVYGIELDWMREALCFNIGHEYEGVEILNDFMMNVKKITDKYEKIRKHRISISARVPSGIETSFYMGFDVVTWAQKKLIDVIVITPRWSSTDTDMPIEIWKRMLLPFNVELATGIEILIRQNRTYPLTINTKETVAANAAVAFSAGADKFYLFNFMSVPGLVGIDESNREHRLLLSNLKDLLNSCSDLENSLKYNRRHFVTFKDFTALWESSKYYVPVTCEPDDTEYALFRIRTGKVSEKSKAYILMGIDTDNNANLSDEDITVFLNSYNLKGVRIYNVNEDYYIKSSIYILEIPNITFLNDINTVEVCANKIKFTIKHIEIDIDIDNCINEN